MICDPYALILKGRMKENREILTSDYLKYKKYNRIISSRISKNFVKWILPKNTTDQKIAFFNRCSSTRIIRILQNSHTTYQFTFIFFFQILTENIERWNFSLHSKTSHDDELVRRIEWREYGKQKIVREIPLRGILFKSSVDGCY